MKKRIMYLQEQIKKLERIEYLQEQIKKLEDLISDLQDELDNLREEIEEDE